MMLEMLLLPYPLLGLLLLTLLGAALLGALLSRQHAPARNKIPRAQRRREVALQQMAALAQRLREQEPGLDPKPILQLPLVELAQKLQAEELSLESVLCSYLEEALKVHQEVNCLTDFLEECEEQLQALKKLKKSERGLLYGVPMSLKDPYDCMGHDSTCGLAQFLEKPAAKDGVLVKVLKAQGAIPFVKTNIPQTLLSFDCSNPIYGQTRNPLNLKKTPGGSSGGEGALLSKGGSILGMGTDTGGSIRMPSSFCGVYGLRTSRSRLSYTGIASAVKGKKSVATVAGPMARDVDSLVLCLRALLSEDMHQLDPTVPFMPFREEIYSNIRPLRIGYYESDGFSQPSPSMARAVRLTCRLLQDAGHEVIPFSIPRIEYAIQKLYTGGLFADGGATLLEKLEGDIVDPSMKAVVTQLRLPDLLKCILARILKYIEPRTAQDLEMIRGVKTPKKLWAQHTAVEVMCAWQDLKGLLDQGQQKPGGDTSGQTGGRALSWPAGGLPGPGWEGLVNYEEYQQEFIAKWRSLDLDVLLSPALGPAFYIGYPAKASASSSYHSLYNMLDFPAGVVPVTTVTLQDEEELAFYKGYYGDSNDRNFKEAVEGSVGLPVAVQCITLPWEEELCLRFMKEVETLTKNQKEPR